MTEILQAVSTVGFPIVACSFLYRMMNTTMKENTAAMQELTQAITSMEASDRELKETILRMSGGNTNGN